MNLIFSKNKDVKNYGEKASTSSGVSSNHVPSAGSSRDG